MLLSFSSAYTQGLSAKKDSLLNFKALVFPVCYFTPETSWALGLSGMKLFKKEDTDTITFTSYLNASAVYTLNKQYRLESNLALYSKENKWTWITNFEYFYFPYEFYGVSNQDLSRQKESLTLRKLTINNKLYTSLGSNIFVGVQNLNKHVWDIDYLSGGFYDTEVTNMGDRGLTIGIGAMIKLDSRDHNLIPKKGYYLKFEYIYFKNFLSNEDGITAKSSFNNFQIDARTYMNLSHEVINAIQIYADFNIGIVPFYKMPAIGSSRQMRGYYGGIVMDKNLVMIQDEIRFPLYKKVTGALFGGVATLYSDWSLIDLPVFPNGGMGIRVLVDDSRGLCLRADYGFGPGVSGFYLTVSEAF